MKILYPPACCQTGDPRSVCLGAATATSHPTSLLALATCNFQGNFATSPSLLSIEKNQGYLPQWVKFGPSLVQALLYLAACINQHCQVQNSWYHHWQLLPDRGRRITYQISRTCAIAAEIAPALTMWLFGMEASGGRETKSAVTSLHQGENNLKTNNSSIVWSAGLYLISCFSYSSVTYN